MWDDSVGSLAFWLAMGAGQVAFWMAIAPLIQAAADRLRGRRLPDDLEERIAALEAKSPVTGETDAVYHRMVELEERVEFAERMLAQTKPEGALPRGEER